MVLLVGTNNSASKEAPIKEETTDQPTPMPQQQEYDPHTGLYFCMLFTKLFCFICTCRKHF